MPLMASLFFIAMVSLIGAMYVPAQEAQTKTSIADVGATSFLAYRESVINYLNVTPGFTTGTVPDTSLTFLWGYQRDARWTNTVSGGTLFTYVIAGSANTDELLDKVYRKTASSFMVGRNTGGQLISANGFQTGIFIPATTPPIPTGSILIVGK